MAKIERVQYQAALAITGTWQGTSRSKLYNELGLESLTDRRSSNRVIQLFKIKNNFTPEYLRNKLTPPLIENIPNANHNILEGKNPRTLRYKNSFFPNAISSWNNIISNIEGNLSKSSIRSHILSIIRPKHKIFYGIHDPIGLHYLFQLRTELSQLEDHKFRHNFRDTHNNNCSCLQGIENTIHFLFDCCNFAIHRVTLAVDVTNILRNHNLLNLANNVELYLYGEPRLPLEDNKKILLATIQYVKNTNRFSRKVP